MGSAGRIPRVRVRLSSLHARIREGGKRVPQGDGTADPIKVRATIRSRAREHYVRIVTACPSRARAEFYRSIPDDKFDGGRRAQRGIFSNASGRD